MENLLSLLELVSEHSEIFGVGFMILLAMYSIRKKSKKNHQAKEVLKTTIEKKLNEPHTLHPEINANLCAGCGSCVGACPEGEILQLINHKASLVHPTKCVGHGACEQVCPFGAIDLVFGTKTRGMEIPRVTVDYETNVPGIYIAGELGGMGLVRNAIKQGRLAAQNAISTLSKKSPKTDVDVLIVGAGPAGFSAALSCVEKKVSYKCIDQNTFGGTIYNFPRQKVVTSHPLDMPIDGTKKFKSNIVSKEDLLSYFSKVRKKTGVKIDEKVNFKNLEEVNGVFKVETSKGTITAKKVLLCMGMRGTPRKLGLKNEDMAKITYNLIDPEQYQKTSIAIVGGGNSALEAAQYLAREQYANKIYLIVRKDASSGLSRSNEANQNAVKELEQRKLIEILYTSAITEINEKEITIKHEEELITVKNDYIFVFAGAEMPFKFLMSLGIEIDKAFGEKQGMTKKVGT